MNFFSLLILSVALAAGSLARDAPEEITGADVLERINRVLRTSAENAVTWHAGVASLEAWPARLEQALLETLGPPEVSEPEAGHAALIALLNEQSQGLRLGPDARAILLTIVAVVDRELAAMRQRDQAVRALEQERAAHRQTREKLEALRQIDQKIDRRADNGAP